MGIFFLKILNNKESFLKENSQIPEILPGHQVAIIGIGGSSQGARSLLCAIDPGAVDRGDYLFFDRIDESFLERQVKLIRDIKNVTWFINSKSGSTTETLIILNTVLEKTDGGFLETPGSIYVSTENKSSVLFNWAKEHHCKLISTPDDIEGRFSLLSEEGVFPLSPKVKWSDLNLATQWVNNNLNLVEQLSSFYLESYRQQKWISVFWLYSERFKEFGFWLEQLWAESLGKFSDSERRASTPLCCMGTNDQHSLLQQMNEGFADKSYTFLQVGKSNTENSYNQNYINKELDYLSNYNLSHLLRTYCKSTYESLENGPKLMITLANTEAQTFYALHVVMALVIGTIGKSLNIEIYGQPGVEKSKAIFKELL